MSPRSRRPRVNRHFRIDDELKPDDLRAYRAFVVEPRTTNKSAHAWLVARGYTAFSESAVARHRRYYLERHENDAGAVSRAGHWARMARDSATDGCDIVAGAVVLSEVQLMHELFSVGGRRVSDEELERLGAQVSRMVNTRIALSKMETAAGRRPSGQGPAPEPPPMTEEEKEEASYKRICALLKQPYHPPEKRAEMKREWEESERRAREGGGTPSDN